MTLPQSWRAGPGSLAPALAEVCSLKGGREEQFQIVLSTWWINFDPLRFLSCSRPDCFLWKLPQWINQSTSAGSKRLWRSFLAITFSKMPSEHWKREVQKLTKALLGEASETKLGCYLVGSALAPSQHKTEQVAGTRTVCPLLVILIRSQTPSESATNKGSHNKTAS